MITSLLLLHAALPMPCQDPTEVVALPANAVARLDQRLISREEYLDFLYLRFGNRALEEYIGELLLAEEAVEYQIVVEDQEVTELLEQREQAARSNPRAGNFEDELRRNGRSLDMYRRATKAEIRKELLLDRLVRATRVVTDERLVQAFELKYGANGHKQRVRHIVIMPNVLRADELRAGAKPNDIDMTEIHNAARARADELLARINAGEDFAAIAATHSHDRVTKNRGGELLNYNGRLYGPDFFAGLKNLAPGKTTAVIKTGAGYHIAQVVERTVTELDDVRTSLALGILESEPSWQEKSALLQALRSRAEVQLW